MKISAAPTPQVLGGIDGWVTSAHLEGGYIHPLSKAPGPGRDAIRITDRFFGPQMRGFDIRGIGPRVLRTPYNTDGTLDSDGSQTSDALGGRAYYMGRLELEFPTSASVRSMGLRPSAFIDVGSVWSLTQPELNDIIAVCSPPSGTTGTIDVIRPTDPNPGRACATNFVRSPGIKEQFLGNSPKPRLAVGVGVNWVSPFGPFRIPSPRPAHAGGDDTQIVQLQRRNPILMKTLIFCRSDASAVALPLYQRRNELRPRSWSSSTASASIANARVQERAKPAPDPADRPSNAPEDSSRGLRPEGRRSRRRSRRLPASSLTRAPGSSQAFQAKRKPPTRTPDHSAEPAVDPGNILRQTTLG